MTAAIAAAIDELEVQGLRCRGRDFAPAAAGQARNRDNGHMLSQPFYMYYLGLDIRWHTIKAGWSMKTGRVLDASGRSADRR